MNLEDTISEFAEPQLKPEPKCWACLSSIQNGQRVCTECNSWQNWRRFFNLSTATLSLLVALVSVSTTAVPILQNALHIETYNLDLHGIGLIHQVDDTYSNLVFRLRVRNSGEIDTKINNNITCFLRKNGEIDNSITRTLITRDEIFIDSGEKIGVEYASTLPFFSEFSKNLNHIVCTLLVNNSPDTDATRHSYNFDRFNLLFEKKDDYTGTLDSGRAALPLSIAKKGTPLFDYIERNFHIKNWKPS